MPAFWFLHPLISNGLALYLIPVTCSQGQTQGFFMTKNNYSISEIIFLSFLPSDHHFLSFQPPSLGPNTQVVPLFQKDLQPILTALSMNTLHPFSLPTHRRFHHHSHCLSFHSILHSLENSNPGWTQIYLLCAITQAAERSSEEHVHNHDD